MLKPLSFILMLLAFLLFALAAYGVTSKFNLVATGLALWVLANMVR